MYVTGRTLPEDLTDPAGEYGLTDIDGSVIPSLRATRGEPIWSPV